MRRGFTLVEILLVFALIGVAAAVTLVSFDMLGRSGESEPPEKALIRAIKEARLAAITEREWTYLRYNEAARSFDIEDSRGNTLHSLELDRVLPADQDPLRITFQGKKQETVGSFPVRPQETDLSLDRVAFSPQRVSAPFSARIEDGDIDLTIQIDAFSALPVELPSN